MNKEERDREKELKYLIYLKSELLKQTKKEIQAYQKELDQLSNNKTYTKRKKR